MAGLGQHQKTHRKNNVIKRTVDNTKKLGGKMVRGAQKQFDKAFYAYADSVKDSPYVPKQT